MNINTKDAALLYTTLGTLHIDSDTESLDPVSPLVDDYSLQARMEVTGLSTVIGHPLTPQSYRGKCLNCWDGVLQCLVCQHMGAVLFAYLITWSLKMVTLWPSWDRNQIW